MVALYNRQKVTGSKLFQNVSNIISKCKFLCACKENCNELWENRSHFDLLTVEILLLKKVIIVGELDGWKEEGMDRQTVIVIISFSSVSILLTSPFDLHLLCLYSCYLVPLIPYLTLTLGKHADCFVLAYYLCSENQISFIRKKYLVVKFFSNICQQP